MITLSGLYIKAFFTLTVLGHCHQGVLHMFLLIFLYTPQWVADTVLVTRCVFYSSHALFRSSSLQTRLYEEYVCHKVSATPWHLMTSRKNAFKICIAYGILALKHATTVAVSVLVITKASLPSLQYCIFHPCGCPCHTQDYIPSSCRHNNHVRSHVILLIHKRKAAMFCYDSLFLFVITGLCVPQSFRSTGNGDISYI